MGNRIHIITKRIVEYGAEGFNWQIDQLSGLLREAGCNINETLNEDAVGEWEIHQEEFEEAVKKVAAMDAAQIAGHFDRDYVGDDTPEKFKKHVVNLLNEFVTTGDCHSGFYHFAWF